MTKFILTVSLEAMTAAAARTACLAAKQALIDNGATIMNAHVELRADPENI